jgi:hypothetical protein
MIESEVKYDERKGLAQLVELVSSIAMPLLVWWYRW